MHSTSWTSFKGIVERQDGSHREGDCDKVGALTSFEGSGINPVDHRFAIANASLSSKVKLDMIVSRPSKEVSADKYPAYFNIECYSHLLKHGLAKLSLRQRRNHLPKIEVN